MSICDNKFRSFVPYVQDVIPSFLVENESLFVDFMEEYFKWTEQQGNYADIYDDVGKLQFLECSVDEYFEQFRQEYLDCFPYDIGGADKKLTISEIRQLYRSKGSENAVKTFFRLLYDEEVEVFYPHTLILRPSDGVWKRDIVFRSTDFATLEDATWFVGKLVEGATSGAEAIIETVVEINACAVPVYEFTISNVYGTFNSDETIRNVIEDVGDEQREFAITNVITSVAVTSKGTGYTQGESVSFYPIDVIQPHAAELISVHETDEIREVLDPDACTGNGVIAEVDGNGGIIRIELQNIGLGYNRPPVAFFHTQNGDGGYATTEIGPVFTEFGDYYDVRGFLDNIVVLQDSKAWHNYAYVIRSTKSIVEYQHALRKLVHPAGIKFIGEVKFPPAYPGTAKNAIDAGYSADIFLQEEYLDHDLTRNIKMEFHEEWVEISRVWYPGTIRNVVVDGITISQVANNQIQEQSFINELMMEHDTTHYQGVVLADAAYENAAVVCRDDYHDYALATSDPIFNNQIGDLDDTFQTIGQMILYIGTSQAQTNDATYPAPDVYHSPVIESPVVLENSGGCEHLPFI